MNTAGLIQVQTFVLLAHVAATGLMAGIIWFVQVVHYPLMAAVDGDHFLHYEREHQRRTSWLVVPAMLTELGLAAWLVITPPSGAAPLAWAGLACLGLIWASTWLVQAPIHRRLARAYDPEGVRWLTTSNWIRTSGWSARLVVALALIHIHGSV